MTWLSNHSPLKHLGSLHGRGSLLIKEGGHELGPVTYEIDGYLERGTRSANGQIEGERAILQQAFGAGAATIVLTSGRCIRVELSDPRGGGTAEVQVRGGFPL